MTEPKRCTLDGCEKLLAAQGMCHMHRNRVRRNGTTELIKPYARTAPLKPMVHGTQRAYQQFGCRCEVCVMATRERARRYHANYKERIAEKRLLKEYGITREDYARMLEAQGGVCAICQGARPDGKPLYVDHCHTTGAVRALLCTQCNTGIGMFGDDPDRLLAAAAYLLRQIDVLREVSK